MARMVHLWWFAVTLVITLVLAVINTIAGVVALLVWGYVVAPYAVMWLHRRTGLTSDADVEDFQVHYWRNDRVR
jgi:hypothetical protein